MKKLTTILFLIAASLASAQQFSYTYTAPIGATSCAVYNTTIQYAVAYGNCPEMRTFYSADNAYSVELQDGSTITVLRITEASTGHVQTVEAGAPVWTVPSTFPAQGVPAAFSMTAPITAVCNYGQPCVAAIGQIDLSGEWAYQVVFIPRHGNVKVWKNTSVLTLNGLSTVAILDQDRMQRDGYLELAEWKSHLPGWLNRLLGFSSEPVEIYL